MTALLSRELDRFLFPDASVGACLHQLLVHINATTPERPDFCIMKLGSDNLPIRPIGISDLKKEGLCAAVIENFGYSSRLMCTRHDMNDFAVHFRVQVMT